MKQKIGRRTLLKTLGTAAAAGTTACSPKLQPTTAVLTGEAQAAAVVDQSVFPRVNLICGGMLLFWQDRTNITAGITIYAPDASMGSMPMHEVLLSTQIGGRPNLLTGPGTYTLKFTCANGANSKPLGRRNYNQNLVIYDTNPSTQGLAVNLSNAQYVLNVPYPSAIRTYRIMQFGSIPPYQTGPGNDTATRFSVSPTQLAGVHILTYNNVNSPVTLAAGNSTASKIVDQTAQADGVNAPPVVNLHFYATRDPRVTPSVSHLQFFNALLSYKGHTTLDLAENPAAIDPTQNPGYHPNTPPGSDQVDGDLNELDLYDLSELSSISARYSDPVGCVIGWAS